MATVISSCLHLRGMSQVVEEGGALHGWEGDGDADGGAVIAFVVRPISILCLGDDDG